MPNDLSTLASIPGAGGAAAFMAGQMQPGNLQEQDLGNQRLQQLVQQLQIGNQQSTAMNPLLLAHQGLQNQGLQAGLPGIGADSDLKRVNADKAIATKDSDVMATIANNHSKIIKDNADDIHNSAVSLGKLAITMSENGQSAGPGTLLNVYQAAQSSGADLKNPFIKSALDHVAHLPVDAAAQALQDMAARAIKLSEKYIDSNDVEAQRAAAQRDVENTRAGSAEKIAQMNIDAGKFNKQDKTSIDARLAGAKTAKEKAEILESASVIAQRGGDTQAAIDYLTRAKEARQRAMEDAGAAAGAHATGQPNVGAIANLPVNEAPTATAPIGGQSPSGTPQLPNSNAKVPAAWQIQKLRANPKMAADFDEHFGKGAAARILGSAQ